MSLTRKDERRVLTDDDLALVDDTHYPAICDLGHRDLVDHARRLRERRDRLRAVTRRRRRQARSGRPGAEPGDSSGAALKESILVGAIKRVNREISRYAAAKGDESQREILERALDQKRAARKANHPSAGRTARSGMAATPDPAVQPAVHPSPPEPSGNSG